MVIASLVHSCTVGCPYLKEKSEWLIEMVHILHLTVRGKTDPTQSDLKYLGLLRSWDKNSNFDFHFIDSHKKTADCFGFKLEKTLENRLMERMRNSKNMLLVLSGETNYNRGLLNFEIEKAVDLYELPLIIAYTDCSHVINYDDC